MEKLLDSIVNGPIRYTQEQGYDATLSLVTVLSAFIIEVTIFYVTLYLILKLAHYSRTFISLLLQRLGVGKHGTDRVFLQLTFPANTTKSAYATERLHVLMHSIVKYRNFWDRWAAQKRPYSLELVATRDGGTLYFSTSKRRSRGDETYATVVLAGT